MIDDLHHLFQVIHWWATISARFELFETPPDDALISNVNVVPFVGDQVVIVQVEGGRYEIPGGTREAGEGYRQTAQRELIEEAGARLLDFTPFGAWFCQSSDPMPYKPHLPHPDYYRIAGYGAVELVSQPTNPPDGERIVAVEVVSVDEARRRFIASGRPDLADLYQLASRIRGTHQ